MKRRANTMKLYILRDPNSVERQNLIPNPRPPRHDPVVAATVDEMCGRPPFPLRSMPALAVRRNAFREFGWNYVPEGHSTIARRFNAGSRGWSPPASRRDNRK